MEYNMFILLSDSPVKSEVRHFIHGVDTGMTRYNDIYRQIYGQQTSWMQFR